MPTVWATVTVILSRSFACHPGRDARVSVQATRKREGRSHSSSARNGQHFPDPSPPAADELNLVGSTPSLPERARDVIRRAFSDRVESPDRLR